jgi:hypothetical protein
MSSWSFCLCIRFKVDKRKVCFCIAVFFIPRWKHGTVSEMCVFGLIRTAMHQRSVLYCNEMQMMKLLCRWWVMSKFG